MNSSVKRATKSGVTAFVDILGFGEKVLNVNSFDGIDFIRGSLEKVRAAFDFKTGDETVREVHKMYKKRLFAFSDCVVINFPLSSSVTKYEGSFDPIMSELNGFAMAQGECVLNGIFLRGGVGLGWWYQRGDIFISDALTRAYKLEGRANVPVLALTDEIFNFIQEHPGRKYYSNKIDPFITSLRRYEGQSKGKPVSFWYLDYIRVCVESVGWHVSKEQIDRYKNTSGDARQKIIDDGYRHNLRMWFVRHADAIKNGHSMADDQVKCKYTWLASYHNEKVSEYIDDKECICNLDV